MRVLVDVNVFMDVLQARKGVYVRIEKLRISRLDGLRLQVA